MPHSPSGPSGEARSPLSLGGCSTWSLKRARNMLNTIALSYEDISIKQLINLFGLVSHVLSKHIRKTGLVSTLIRDTWLRNFLDTLAPTNQFGNLLRVTSQRLVLYDEEWNYKTPNADTVFGQINYIRTSPHY